MQVAVAERRCRSLICIILIMKKSLIWLLKKQVFGVALVLAVYRIPEKLAVSLLDFVQKMFWSHLPGERGAEQYQKAQRQRKMRLLSCMKKRCSMITLR